jgi:hypothetical protein
MNNRISHVENKNTDRDDRREPQPIGEVLAELLAQYQARFPEVRITVAETPTTAI